MPPLRNCPSMRLHSSVAHRTSHLIEVISSGLSLLIRIWGHLTRIRVGEGRIMRLLCSIVGHRRSKKWASFEVSTHCWHSICKRCHTQMVREQGGKWRRSMESKQAA
jgi:hypothetical protein